MTEQDLEVAGRSRYREPEPTLDFGFADDVPIDPDPLDPHPEHPTPLDLVVRLTRSERVSRVQRLVAMAWNRFDEAMESIRGQRVAGVCALVSGGNDSYTVAHVFRSVTTHWVHANTQTGIEATREHVRSTARLWGLDYERKHTILWNSPLAIWHKADLRAYRLINPDMPLNPVAQRLGMSGECGCLSMATHPGERDQWFDAYPEEPFILAVHAMEQELQSRSDIPDHRKRWGWGADPAAQAAEAEYLAQRRRAGQEPETVEFTSDTLCGPNCGPDPLFDLMDPLFTAPLFTGTTLLAAQQLGRRAIGIELNPEYCAMALRRCQDAPLFTDEEAG